MRVLVPLAAGFEEIEAVTVIDLLRRAGIEVVAAGLQAGPCTGSRGVVVVPDTPFDAVAAAAFDAVVLPGGAAGAEALAADARVLALLRRHAAAGKLVAAICAAPIVLHAAGLAAGRRVTSHPSVAARLTDAHYVEAPVVRDGALLTSRGPGTALPFALALIGALLGEAKAAEVRAPLMLAT